MPQRIQKLLANAGLGSRRQIESWIKDGRIEVNGQLATIGMSITPTDTVRFDGEVVQLNLPSETKVIIYNKPEGQICSRSDPVHQDSVFDYLPELEEGRWISVGRLDINSQGLLLFTNDGELANQLMHPSHQVEREYAVRVLGVVSQKILRQLTEGVQLEDGLAKFNRIEDAGGQGANHWYHVVLTEGRYREVRRMWDSVGITVSRLIRIRYGKVKLPKTLKPGQWQAIDKPII